MRHRKMGLAAGPWLALHHSSLSTGGEAGYRPKFSQEPIQCFGASSLEKMSLCHAETGSRSHIGQVHRINRDRPALGLRTKDKPRLEMLAASCLCAEYSKNDKR